MRVALLYPDLPEDAPPDERDVLDQAAAVREALEANGHRAIDLSVDLDLAGARKCLMALDVDCAFNLVESMEQDDRGILIVPTLLESLGLPYTGAPLQAVLMTTNKPVAKRLLRDAGLPTPPWFAPGDPAGRAAELVPGRVIVKPVWDHGSKALDESDVFETTDSARLGGRIERDGSPERFVERYVEGREFNLALLDGPRGVETLPPAEMCFENYADGRPRVVGYRAKWVGDSFEATHTVRRFDFDEADGPLLADLSRLARACWACFGLRGYARVDVRVDPENQPWILEVNVNPCLAPGAGFAAALERAGVTFSDAIERIVVAALGARTGRSRSERARRGS